MLYSKPIVVAEIGCNHQGDILKAKELIKSAAKAGATYVKFQKRNNKYLLGKKFNSKHPVPENSFGNSYGLHREFLELSINEHYDLYKYCKKNNVKYATSVWEKKSAKSIIDSRINLDFIKVPSACNLDFELLEYLANNFKKKIHVSLGMTNRKEMESIFNFFKKKKRLKDLFFYACTSNYPADFDDIYLLDITYLQKKYGSDINGVGYSGHHLGIAIDNAAYTLGAKIIERHFTLDRTLKGTDHAASLEPTGLTKLCRDLNNTFFSLKLKVKPKKNEISQRKKLTRKK